jgi:hypothetical protein
MHPELASTKEFQLNYYEIIFLGDNLIKINRPKHKAVGKTNMECSRNGYLVTGRF